jgi:hypothetical protein
MTREDLRNKIRAMVPIVYKSQKKSDIAAVEFDELTKFPELKAVIIDLLTSDFNSFLSSIDWVAPRPTTFRINLKNGHEFYLSYNRRSWIAQVEGKKYYLLNLPEEERAAEAIARILRYESKAEDAESTDVTDAENLSLDTSEEEVEETPPEA